MNFQVNFNILSYFYTNCKPQLKVKKRDPCENTRVSPTICKRLVLQASCRRRKIHLRMARPRKFRRPVCQLDGVAPSVVSPMAPVSAPDQGRHLSPIDRAESMTVLPGRHLQQFLCGVGSNRRESFIGLPTKKSRLTRLLVVNIDRLFRIG